MATIGTFAKSENGFTGSIKTLTLNTKARITPVEKTNDKAPDYRIFAGSTEVGAGWKKTSNEGRAYISCRIDDVSWPSQVYASLVEVDGEFALIWSRRNDE